ncbi:MAG: DUF418 domain-containing protein [Flavobacteriales bacterium]|nr:DUF418 domain-containing protein [Flavobacteriales bacterium]
MEGGSAPGRFRSIGSCAYKAGPVCASTWSIRPSGIARERREAKRGSVLFHQRPTSPCSARPEHHRNGEGGSVCQIATAGASEAATWPCTRVSAWQFEVLARGVFVVEVIWSRWWLARFQYGPFEWVWRSLTYGRVMPMRKRV